MDTAVKRPDPDGAIGLSAAMPAENPSLPGVGRRALARHAIALIVVCAMAAPILSLAVIRHERSSAALHERRLQEMARDIARSISELDRLAPDARPQALKALERDGVRFHLSGAAAGTAPEAARTQELASRIVSAVRPFPVLKVAQVPYAPEVIRVQVGLRDGMTVVVNARAWPEPISWIVVWSLLGEVLLMSACIFLVHRRLAAAVDAAHRRETKPACPSS